MARKLASKMPPVGLTYFSQRQRANDLAITMARLFTGNLDVIALRNAYHGGSSSSLALTSHHTWKYTVQAQPGVHHALCPDPALSPLTGTAEEIASESAADIRELIRFSTPGKIAAFCPSRSRSRSA